MRDSGVVWGSLLIVLGLMLVAGTMLEINIWPLILPTALILAGLWFLVAALRGQPDVYSEEIRILREGARRADVTVHHGAGRLILTGGAASDALLEGTFAGGLKRKLERHGERAVLDIGFPEDIWIRSPFYFGSWGWSINWDAKLPSDLPLELTLKTGAGESQINLSEVLAERIRLSTGASATELTLPAGAGRIQVEVEAGAASVSIRVPENVAANIHVDSGLAGITVDKSRFPNVGGDYRSPGYEQASQAADIRIQCGVGAVSIQ